MPWLRFTADHDFSPAALKGRVTVAYKAGMVCNVTRECATAAVTSGKAKAATSPRKDRNDGSDGRG